VIEPMSREVLARQELVLQALVVVPPWMRWPPCVKFEAAEDDIAAFCAAPLMLDGELPFALFRYDTSPPNELEIRLPDTIDLAQVQQIVERILAGLDLAPAAAIWQRTRRETPF
jgi:hypothetical protein